MIFMDNVYKTYPNGVTALNGISVDIAQGEFVYIVGHSGAGKSTFIKLIYREEKPSKGHVFVNEMDLGKIKEKKVPFLRREIGVVFQDFKLLPKLTVYENIAYALEVIEQSPRAIRIRVMEVLEEVGLKNKARFLPAELSGGEQQRVSIARAIVNRPRIVIADEPTGNLDSKTSLDVIGLLKMTSNKFNQTMVMITHNEEIAQLADRIIRIEDGKVAIRGDK